MATLIGNYVKTFAEATHALPDGMPMNADYPLMLPEIVKLTKREVTLRGRHDATAPIRRRGDQEYCSIAQMSSFEILCCRRPQRFRFYPFKHNPDL